MNWLFSVLLSIHILVAIAIIGLVLMQHGKGADMGAAFGGGASGSLFGATGSANFLSRSTAVLATVFFSTSLALAYVASERPRAASSVMESSVMKTQPAAQSDKAEAASPADAAAAKSEAAAKTGDTAPASKANAIPN